MSKLKPFIKYTGGKTKLLSSITPHFPKEFNNYYEPFVGGGSVFLELFNITDNINISDINQNLINCYTIIKNNLQDLLLELKKPHYTNISEQYYTNRNRFNEIKNNNDYIIEQVALFIYLNKTSYNGMYRENQSGKFNVPFGKMKNPVICDELLLTYLSNKFQNKNINIHCYDYKNILPFVKENDFVYLDPPYDEVFTNYTSNIFHKNEQQHLKQFIDTLTEKNVKFVLSNSATDFIKNLYKNYTIVNITTKYSIGGKNADRGLKNEVLIKNF